MAQKKVEEATTPPFFMLMPTFISNVLKCAKLQFIKGFRPLLILNTGMAHGCTKAFVASSRQPTPDAFAPYHKYSCASCSAPSPWDFVVIDRIWVRYSE